VPNEDEFGEITIDLFKVLSRQLNILLLIAKLLNDAVPPPKRKNIREGHLALMKGIRKHAKMLLKRLQGKKQIVSRMCGWDNNTEMDVKQKCGVN
jgi:hypothetical protein